MWILMFFIHDSRGSWDVKLWIRQIDTEPKVWWEESWSLRDDIAGVKSGVSSTHVLIFCIYLFCKKTAFRHPAVIQNTKIKVLHDHHNVVAYHGSRTLSKHEKMWSVQSLPPFSPPRPQNSKICDDTRFAERFKNVHEHFGKYKESIHRAQLKFLGRICHLFWEQNHGYS